MLFLSVSGWVNGISSSFTFVFGIVFGISLICKYNKTKTKLLSYLGFGSIFMGTTYFSFALDFFTILITGNNFPYGTLIPPWSNTYLYDCLFTWMWVGLGGLFGIIIGIELFFSTRKRYITFFFIILCMLYEFFLFLNTKDYLILIYPATPGEDLIDGYFLFNSLPFIILLFFFLFLLIFMIGGFFLRSLQATGLIRKSFLYLSFGFLFLVILPYVFEAFTTPGILVWVIRASVIIGWIMVYQGLKPQKTRDKKKKLPSKEVIKLASYITGREISPDSLRKTGDSNSSKLVKKYYVTYQDLLYDHPEHQKNEFRAGIAQIGLSHTNDIMTEFYHIKKTGLLGIKEDKLKQTTVIVKEHLEKAYNMNIQLIIFPEMTIDLNNKDFLNELIEIAKSYSMYIVPGSYHDDKTKKNMCVVIGPNGIQWEQQKHIPATIHIGDKRFVESIDTGSLPKEIVVCNTEHGRIAIAICRDFLDMDLRVELKNHEPPIDIIINPAFTPVTTDFKAAHFDARRSVYAYCFFANVAEFGDSFIYTPEKERIERTLPVKTEGIIYKDIDLFQLRYERQKWEKEQSKERKFIQSTRN